MKYMRHGKHNKVISGCLDWGHLTSCGLKTWSQFASCTNECYFEFTGTVNWSKCDMLISHYDDVIMGTVASQIISLTIVYSTVYSNTDQRKHQSSASLAFVWGIHRGSVNSRHKWPVTRKMFPFDDVIMMLTTSKYVPKFLINNWSLHLLSI